jgi:hypothetical protein
MTLLIQICDRCSANYCTSFISKELYRRSVQAVTQNSVDRFDAASYQPNMSCVNHHDMSRLQIAGGARIVRREEALISMKAIADVSQHAT